MSLITRLTVPLPGETKIPSHQFMSLVAELQRGVLGVDKALITSTFEITAPEELAELDAIIGEILNRRTDRLILHDVLLLGEYGIYDEQKVDNRIAQDDGDTDLAAITERQVYRIQQAANAGEFAFRGCNVNAQQVPDLTVSVTAGVILANGMNVVEVAALATRTIAAPDAVLPRIDLIYVDNTGTVLVRTGTPALEPQAPTVGLVNECALAFLFVGAGATAIQGKHIQDVTVRRSHGAMRIGGRTNSLTYNNSNTIVQLFGQDVPSQLLKGRMVRVVASGTLLCSSAMTVDWRVRYGGSILWRDLTASIPISLNRRVWRLELELFGQGDSAQVLSGTFSLGAATLPNNGLGVIDNDEIHAWSPIQGISAVDSTVAQNFNFATIMSVANVGNEISIDYALAELV